MTDNNDNSIDRLRKKLDTQRTDKKLTKTSAQVSHEIHSLRLSGSKQILSLRWILFVVIVLIAIIHLAILYYFLNKAGNINILKKRYFLSNNVLITFLITTTFDIIGLLAIITRWLFPPQSSRK